MRYLVARPRRDGTTAYYWSPKSSLIRAGFEVTRLPNDAAQAHAKAQALNDKLDRWYAGEPLETPSVRPWTMAALDEAMQADHGFKRLSPRSQRDYGYAIKPALEWAGNEKVAHVTRLAVMTWLRGQVEARGAANTRNTGAALRRLLAFGRDQGWRTDNPAAETRLPMPPSRTRVWTLAERDQFVDAANMAGHPSMAAAVMLGWCLGQRPADLRTLAWSAYDGSAVALRQRKTGKSIWVPALPELRRLLDKIERADAVQIVVSEETGRPYQESAFQHEFARIRRTAELPNDLQFRDLRRTLATALGAAGCTDDQIRAITGHTTRGVVAIYVRPDRTFAEGAMKRLEQAGRKKK